MLSNRGRDIVDRRIETGQRPHERARRALRALSPVATLARGYAIAQLDDGSVVRDAAQAPAGAALRLTVENGTLAARSEGAVPDVVPHGTTDAAPRSNAEARHPETLPRRRVNRRRPVGGSRLEWTT